MNALESLKGLASMVKRINDIELYSKIIDFQTEVFELIEENHELKQEIKSLKQNIEILKQEELLENELCFKGHFYYKTTEKEEDGPYCSSCWDNNRKLIRAHISDSMGFNIGRCPICDFASSYLE